MKSCRISQLLISAAVLVSPGSRAQVVHTFTTTGAVQYFTVPACVSSLTLEAWGAQGGANWANNVNYGGYAKGVFTVTSGNVLYIYAGSQPSGTLGGFNGGGNGENLGQGGGGASDVRMGGQTYSNRIIVAGGGGGAGYWSNEHVVGGLGGGLVGTDGYRTSTSNPGGQGGTQSGSGLGTCVTLNNPSVAGGFGFGGSPSGCGCEGYGGGGGWYGGAGSGNCRGGGGGSGYLLSSATGTAFTTGSNIGHGKVVLSYFTNGSGVTVTPSSAVICSGSSVTLNGSGVVSYTWSVGTNSNNSSITVAPASNTSYTVNGTNSLGCISTVVVNVTVSAAAPVLTVSASNTSLCLGKSASLTASGALTYTWSNGISNGVPFIPTGTNVYTVSGQNGCGITTAMQGITVAPLPITAIASPSIICSQNAANLTASGATSYTWNPGPLTGSSVAVAPSSTTIYTVTASDGTCSGVASLTLTAKANPTLVMVGTSTNICEGESVSLTLGGADTYTWIPAGITGTSVVVTPSSSILYQVSGTNSVGCTTGTSYVIIVKPAPVVNGNLSNTVICLGASANLAASGAVSYTWSHGPQSASVTVTPAVNTVYTVTGEGTNSCTASRNYTVTVIDPVLGVSPSTAICVGAIITLTSGPGSNFSWSPNGGNFPSIQATPSVTTIYTVSATTSSSGVNCPRSNTVLVTVNQNPTVTATAPTTIICRNDKVNITASGALTYTWSNQTVTATLVYFSNVTSVQTITFSGMDANGCKDDGNIQIRVNACAALEESQPIPEIRIYPNPNSGRFTVSGRQTITLQLFNALGQQIRCFELNVQNSYRFEVAELANGIYFISANGSEKNNLKVVVDR